MFDQENSTEGQLSEELVLEHETLEEMLELLQEQPTGHNHDADRGRKIRRLRLKDEIIRRANKGDLIAYQYALKKEWIPVTTDTKVNQPDDQNVERCIETGMRKEHVDITAKKWAAQCPDVAAALTADYPLVRGLRSD